MEKKNNTTKKTPMILRLIRWTFPKLEKLAPSLAGKWAWNLFFTPFRFPIPKQEQAVVESAELFYLEAGGETIQGYKWGNEDKYILVLHGWAGRATQFQKFIKPLNDKGYTVIGIDGPAHGNSTGTKTHILKFVDVLKATKEKFPAIEAVIAHSFGGASSLMAIRNGLDISKLVNIGTPTVADYIISDFLRRINGTEKSGDKFKQNVIDKFGRSFDEFSAMESIKYVEDKIDLLMIHDKNDKEVPVQHSLDLHKSHSSTNLILTEGLGHMRILKDDAVIANAINFVTEEKLQEVLA